MEIFYKKDTLYVNVDDVINEGNISDMKRKVFGIIDDYDIENIVLNIIGNVNDLELLDNFIKEYKLKYNGNITVR